ncbi:MAG: TrbI/VirB10 family protein [Thermoanaerobaculia bacterium]|nr:TrbI/VirB10 family protein [Thermoanaerobaculia bacterium]
MNVPKNEPEAAKVVQTQLPDAARLKRRHVMLGFLGAVGLLVVLTVNFSRRPIGEAGGVAPKPMTLPALGVEQIEAIAKRAEEGRRQLEGRPARFSDGGPYLPPDEREEEELGKVEEGRMPPGWDEPTPPLLRPRPEGPKAIEAPLVPGDSGVGAASKRSADTEVGRDSVELALLERVAAGLRGPELGLASLPAGPQPLSTQLFSSSSAPGVAVRTRVRNRLLAAGSTIPLVLAHRVVTDVPGPVVGISIRDVYDTLTSSRLLLPRGARCFGEIQGQPVLGDNRVTIAWSNCQANGVRLELGPQGSAALDGSAGIPAHVNQHWGQRLGTALALSFISAGVQLAQPERRDSAFGLTPGQILAGQVGTDLGRVSTQILERGFARPPTLTLEAGTAVQILILSDLEVP